MSVNNTPGDATIASYQKVRAGFIMNGTTLNEWCKTNGVHIQNVRSAFLGEWNGTKAAELRKRVTEASGAAQK